VPSRLADCAEDVEHVAVRHALVRADRDWRAAAVPRSRASAPGSLVAPDHELIEIDGAVGFHRSLRHRRRRARN
jgi:hypothetical protein